MYEALSDNEQEQIKETYDISGNVHTLISSLLHNIEPIDANGLIKLDKTFLDCVIKYREINILMTNFYSSTQGDKKKLSFLPVRVGATSNCSKTQFPDEGMTNARYS